MTSTEMTLFAPLDLISLCCHEILSTMARRKEEALAEAKGCIDAFCRA